MGIGCSLTKVGPATIADVVVAIVWADLGNYISILKLDLKQIT